ncbi:MAG: ester cyclase [Bacteroidota bacterium]|nr:ester cyclase [Bacteroidota bacterium]
MNSDNTTMKTKDPKNKTTGQQVIDAWNSRTDEIILPFYTHDYVVEDITAGRIREGWEGLRQWTKSVFTAFPNLHYTLIEQVEHDNKLVLHWLAKGNHQGPLMKIPATGKNVFIHGMSILTLENGKIKHGQVMWDLAGVLRQIGLLPSITH